MVLLVEGWIRRIGLLLLIRISRIGMICSIVVPLVEELAIVDVMFGQRSRNIINIFHPCR